MAVFMLRIIQRRHQGEEIPINKILMLAQSGKGAPGTLLIEHGRVHGLLLPGKIPGNILQGTEKLVATDLPVII